MIKKITVLVLMISITNTFSQSLNFIDRENKLLARSGSASATDALNENVYVANGFSILNQNTSEIEKYNFASNSWQLYTTPVPTIAKHYANAEIIANNLYLFNGLTSNGVIPINYPNDKLEIIDLNTGSITVNSSINPNPVFSAGSSVFGDFMVTFGGCKNEFNADYSNKLYKISPTGTWTELAEMPNALMTKGEVIYGDGTNSKLYVFGGFRETNFTNQNFETTIPNSNIELTDWINFAETGTKVFVSKFFGGNKYAQMSAFSGVTTFQEPSNISWLISNPVSVSSTNPVYLNFETKDGFDNGATLQVYLITNWTGNSTTSTKTLLNATIASGTAVGYAVNFTKSGRILLTGDLSNFRIAFKYIGGYSPNQATTTFQIDNVRVYEETKSNAITIYDFATNSWETSSTVLPQSISAYSICKDDSNLTNLYITGDYDNQTFTGYYNTLNDTFTTLPQTNMIGRRHHNSEIYNNSLYIFGGNTTASTSSIMLSTQSAELETLNVTDSFFTRSSEFKVYPNPANEFLFFDTTIKNVSVFSIDGKQIEIQRINQSISISKLARGTYFILGENDNGELVSSKFVKE